MHGLNFKRKGPENMENIRPRVLVTRKLPAAAETRLRLRYDDETVNSGDFEERKEH